MAKVTGQVLGGETKVVENVHTVGDVREEMGVSSAHSASVNGEPADDETVLGNGQFVDFAPAVKGGQA